MRIWVRIRMMTVRAGGSSRVLRKAWGVAAVIFSASSTTKTFVGPSTGLSAARRSSSRTVSIRRAGVPLGLPAGGVGPSRCTSGCRPFSARSAAGPPDGATSAAARARAVALRPEPSGPTKA